MRLKLGHALAGREVAPHIYETRQEAAGSLASGSAPAAHRPLNCGVRFSGNARAPSAKSSERTQRSWAVTSSSMVAARAGRAEASSTHLARPSATGAQANSSSHSAPVAASSSPAAPRD
jgi:hypothetical protein